MKKKIWMYLAFSAILLAVLETPVMGDELTNPKEISAFNSRWGAEMRLLQLSYSIEKNILWGKQIVSEVKKLNSSTDTSNLEAIVAELSVLREEVSQINTSTGGDVAAHDFVDAKAYAINLTKQFREEVHSILSTADILRIEKNLSKSDHSELRNISKEITKNMIEFNSERIGGLLKDVNVNDLELMEKIRNGSISKKEVSERLRNDTKNLTKRMGPPRPPLGMALKEDMMKGRIYMRAVDDARMHNQLGRMDERLADMLQRAKELNLSPEVLAKIEERMNHSEDWMGKIEDRMDERVGFVGNWTDRRIGRLENLSDKFENRSDYRAQEIIDLLQAGNLTDEEKTTLEKRLSDLENRTERKEGFIDKAINHTEKIGGKMLDRLDRIGNKTLSGGKKDE